MCSPISPEKKKQTPIPLGVSVIGDDPTQQKPPFTPIGKFPSGAPPQGAHKPSEKRSPKSRPNRCQKIACRQGLVRRSEKNLFLPNRLFAFVRDRWVLPGTRIFLTIRKCRVGFCFSMRAKRAYSFIFRFWFCRLGLSTGRHVKDLIKLKPRARALRFLQPLFYKGCRGVSVPDRPNVAVPDRPNIRRISVPDRPCLFTAKIKL